MNMKLAFTLACGLAAILVAPARAQTNASGGMSGMILSQSNHLTATIQDIDHAKREVTLKGQDGNTVKVAVGDNVRNFDQMKKGDRVGVTYYESVALALGKPGEPLTPTGRSQFVVRAAPGEKPGGAAASVTQASATVEDIDRDKHEVTLRTQDGALAKVLVDPSVGNLENIKKGDRINATVTQALAISVTQPDEKP
jgi:Cu/Ag efflux protein CusF